MPRTARKQSKSGIYHIILRGVNKQTIFYDDEDREVFLSRIKLAKEKFPFDFYAFCFMGNHIHLLFREKEVSIGKVMQKILTSYVFWYNSKYERIGNLFQDRYKSEPIEDDKYLLCAARYIHQNPVKAGLVKFVHEWNWSSYGAYINGKSSVIQIEFFLEMFKSKLQFIEFMNQPEEMKFLEPTENFKISDDKLLKEIKKILKIKDLNEIYQLNKIEMYDKIKMILEIEGSNPYQISRVTGIPFGIIRGLSS